MGYPIISTAALDFMTGNQDLIAYRGSLLIQQMMLV